MKNINKSLLFILSVYFNLSIAQNVGINTSNPQQKLHVSGASSSSIIGSTGINLVQPTIRVDGLNSANNSSAFLGTNSISPLYVNSNGDTSVILGINLFSYSAPGTDALPTSTTVNVLSTGTPSGGSVNVYFTPNLLTTNFTLSQTSIVDITAALSAQVQTTSGGMLSDNKARSIGSGIYFLTAPTNSGIDTTSSIANETLPFTSNTGGTSSIMYLNPNIELVLPAGSYSVCMRGFGSSPSQGDNTYNFNIIFGRGTDDKLNIVARPL